MRSIGCGERGREGPTAAAAGPAALVGDRAEAALASLAAEAELAEGALPAAAARRGGRGDQVGVTAVSAPGDALAALLRQVPGAGGRDVLGVPAADVEGAADDHVARRVDQHGVGPDDAQHGARSGADRTL